MDTRWQSVEKWLSAAASVLVTSCATSGWHAVQIDGSSAVALEGSIASLRNELPSGRREDFDESLAVIWMRVVAVNGGDVDGDGDAESSDARALIDAATVLLGKIRRGGLVHALEEYNPDVTAEYFEQLHGLRFDEVLALADLDAADPYLAELRRAQACDNVRRRGPSTPLTRQCTLTQLRQN